VVVALTSDSPSPAAAEAARLARAEQAMKQFCIDLSGLVGRTLESSKLDLENLDLVTAEIYTAAIDAGIDINAVMTADAEDVASTLEGRAPWMGNCSRVLAKLRRNVPESSYHRILEVWTGSQKDALRDPDAQVALEYATYFFDEREHDVDALVDLGSCLLDYAFTRQGLDDELARVTKRKPADLQKALVRAGGGKEEPKIFSRKPQGIDEHLDSIKYELFVIAVKRALRFWKPELVVDIIRMHPDSVYRVAMCHSGFPTGDELVRKVYVGASRHKDKHPSALVTIGHAALSLEVLMARRELDPSDHGIQLVKEFCRTCGSGLQRAPHGCCMTDRMTQATELQAFASKELRSRAAVQELRELQDLWNPPLPVSEMFPHRQHSSSRQPAYQKKDSYELRTTPLLDGSPPKLEVHLDIWEEGIWQEVPSLEAADAFAVRALQEDERARALTRASRQGATHPEGDYRVIGSMTDTRVNKHSTATAGRMKEPTIEQLIICKYPTCSKFATRSYGRYCPHHAKVMSDATCVKEGCSTSSTTGSDFCVHHQEEHMDGVVKALEEHVAVKEVTALAKVSTKAQELELRQLNSQTNFGKSLRWLSIVLGGVALGLTKSLLVLPFVAVAWVMAYAFIDHRAIEAQKRKAIEEKSS
jgi:hypothetical protein